MHQAQLSVSSQVLEEVCYLVSDLWEVNVASCLCLYLCLCHDLAVELHVVVEDVRGLVEDTHKALEDNLVVDVDSQGMLGVDNEHSEHKDQVAWKDHILDSQDRLVVDMLQEDILAVLAEPHGLEVSALGPLDNLEELRVPALEVHLGERLEVLVGLDVDLSEPPQEGSPVALVVDSGRSIDDSNHSVLAHMDLVLVQLAQVQQLEEVDLLELFVVRFVVQALQAVLVAADRHWHRLHMDPLEPGEQQRQPPRQQQDRLVEDIHKEHFSDHSPPGRQEWPVGSPDSWLEDTTSRLLSELLQNHPSFRRTGQMPVSFQVRLRKKVTWQSGKGNR